MTCYTLQGRLANLGDLPISVSCALRLAALQKIDLKEAGCRDDWVNNLRIIATSDENQQDLLEGLSSCGRILELRCCRFERPSPTEGLLFPLLFIRGVDWSGSVVLSALQDATCMQALRPRDSKRAPKLKAQISDREAASLPSTRCCGAPAVFAVLVISRPSQPFRASFGCCKGPGRGQNARRHHGAPHFCQSTNTKNRRLFLRYFAVQIFHPQPQRSK